MARARRGAIPSRLHRTYLLLPRESFQVNQQRISIAMKLDYGYSSEQRLAAVGPTVAVDYEPEFERRASIAMGRQRRCDLHFIQPDRSV